MLKTYVYRISENLLITNQWFHSVYIYYLYQNKILKKKFTIIIINIVV